MADKEELRLETEGGVASSAFCHLARTDQRFRKYCIFSARKSFLNTLFNTYTMKKIIALLLCLHFGSMFHAQNTFEYERTWGTYFGPAGGQLAGVWHNGAIFFDTQQNMYMRGHVWSEASNGNAYYNQFLLGGGEAYQSQAIPLFEATVSAQGTPIYYGYDHNGPLNSETDILEAIDQQDNKYYIFYGAVTSIQPTADIFMPTDPQPASTGKIMLAKYSPAGVLLWATYLPSIQPGIMVETDEAGSVYISGTTTVTQNISTSGVLQEQFDVMYDSQGDLIANGYLLKLNASGQRVWGTYLPARAGTAMQYYNGSLYMLTGPNTNPSLQTMATPGAHQTTLSDLSITKMNATSGTRQWGTYYGPSAGSSLVIPTGLAVNETGLYVTGTDFNFNNSSFFGTPGSFKPAVTGDSDLFLSKFSLSGNREWSTYFGHSGSDMNESDQVLALNGNDIYLSGNSYGTGNNIATPGSYQDAPQFNSAGSYNFYFVKFNSAGNLVWSSYYGGTNNPAGIIIPINIAVEENVLYLTGSTNSNSGYATEDAWMPERIPSTTNQLTMFSARFDLKNQMSTGENEAVKDLVLYNNPNSGNFSLSGNILQKEKCSVKIYDMAGRLVYQQQLTKQKTQHFNLEGRLAKGNYLIDVRGSSQQKLKVFKMTVLNGVGK